MRAPLSPCSSVASAAPACRSVDRHGTWVTHDFDEETSIACARAALDHGITTFDSADEYAAARLRRPSAGPSRTSAARAWSSPRRRTGRRTRRERRGLSRKHLMDALDRSLRRLRTDYVDIYHAHRFDRRRRSTRPCRLRRPGPRGQGAVSRGLRVDRGPDPRRPGLARGLRVPLVSSEPQYSMLWRVIEAEICRPARTWASGSSSGRRSPRASSRGSTCPAQATGRHRGADERASAGPCGQFLTDEVLTGSSSWSRWRPRPGSPARAGVAWVLHNRA